MKKKKHAPEGMKCCRKCGNVKSNSEFYAAPKLKCGLHSWCKPCCTGRVRQSQRDNPDRERARARAYYLGHKKEKLLRAKEWRLANPERFRELKRRGNDKASETISDHYIANQLNARISEIPPELIEAKRLQLKIKRELQNGNYRYHKPAKRTT